MREMHIDVNIFEVRELWYLCWLATVSGRRACIRIYQSLLNAFLSISSPEPMKYVPNRFFYHQSALFRIGRKTALLPFKITRHRGRHGAGAFDSCASRD
jgi:hypothetical protein